MTSARLGLALSVALPAAIAGYFALVAPKTAGKVAEPNVDRPPLLGGVKKTFSRVLS